MERRNKRQVIIIFISQAQHILLVKKVNRETLAELRNCQDDSPLQGSACTNHCHLFRTCKIKRTPLLIQTLSVKGKFQSVEPSENIFGLYVSTYALMQAQPEEYINSVFEDGLT